MSLTFSQVEQIDEYDVLFFFYYSSYVFIFFYFSTAWWDCEHWSSSRFTQIHPSMNGKTHLNGCICSGSIYRKKISKPPTVFHLVFCLPRLVPSIVLNEISNWAEASSPQNKKKSAMLSGFKHWRSKIQYLNSLQSQFSSEVTWKVHPCHTLPTRVSLGDTNSCFFRSSGAEVDTITPYSLVIVMPESTDEIRQIFSVGK